MKRIVILCDGTWNRSDSKTPTNVVQLGQAVAPVATDGTVQVPIYIQGVGTGEGVTRVSRKLDSVLGGAFGWGLLDNIAEAYRHLVFLYEPGDEIYIFGFSRGAYTARSLTGFIRSTGIVNRDSLDLIPEAISRYRTLDQPKRTHPSSDASHEFRARLSPRVVTSEAEADWRAAKGMPEAPRLRISFLGVWDSVGALGVPAHIPILGEWAKRRYRFHDADLSSMVVSARHAVALDEKRKSFEPTRWTNIAELNQESGNPDPALYQERFFAGDHGSVGGGGDIRSLSSIALTWMMEGADAAGLQFNSERVAKIETEHDPNGPLRNTREAPTGIVNWLTRLFPKDRTGPDAIDELHSSVMDRVRTDPTGYRPGSLANIHEKLALLLADEKPKAGLPKRNA
ncbi:DUF2235 domain-containing protein [Roseivivax sp. THAF30]|uniref:DUF2235 domain-containing protein n=1 Tax=Roseivivax sp. THAF30 TaxID=2587852 RepID=UPI0012A9632E|nr:DUF2235 domain-containing protein [Roseivivax sp. THAF30]QFT61755.1 hypothetical protein FIU91_02345 [Roseivivax sp. THAF30]